EEKAGYDVVPGTTEPRGWQPRSTLPQFEEMPVAVGESGLFGDAAGCGVAIGMHVNRDRAIPQDALRCLGHKLPRKAAAAISRLGPDRNLVTVPVVLLEPDPGGVLPVLPVDQHITVEWPQPLR